MVKAIVRASALLGATFLLQGCASVYNEESVCPGYIQDGVCRDMREVYEATHDYDRAAYRDALRAQHEAEQNSRSDRTLFGGRSHTEQHDVETVGQSAAMPYLLADSQPRPLLTQAVAVRVYVDPYQDNSGRLHKPGYVYVRARESEWIFGAEQAEGSRVVTPLITDD
jgi:type IV conjugative transfer system lipoprotein TraV